MQSQKANSAYLGDKFTVAVVLLSIPSDSHLCTLHSQHQLATSIQIQIDTQLEEQCLGIHWEQLVVDSSSVWPKDF